MATGGDNEDPEMPANFREKLSIFQRLSSEEKSSSKFPTSPPFGLALKRALKRSITVTWRKPK